MDSIIIFKLSCCSLPVKTRRRTLLLNRGPHPVLEDLHHKMMKHWRFTVKNRKTENTQRYKDIMMKAKLLAHQFIDFSSETCVLKFRKLRNASICLKEWHNVPMYMFICVYSKCMFQLVLSRRTQHSISSPAVKSMRWCCFLFF